MPLSFFLCLLIYDAMLFRFPMHLKCRWLPPCHKHQKLLLTASMSSRGTKYTGTHWVQEGSTFYISHDWVWNSLGRNARFPFQPVAAEPSVAMDESPKKQIVNCRSVSLSCASSKYCSEISHLPAAPVSCITNQRELWQNASYTQRLAASLDRYLSFSLPLVRRWKLNMLQGGICPRGKVFCLLKTATSNSKGVWLVWARMPGVACHHKIT